MKKLFFFLLILVSVPFLASDFKWSHNYQEGSSQELISLSNKLSGNLGIRSAPTEGFSVQRPAFSLKCGKGTIAYEMDDQKIVRGIYFEGQAAVSFNLQNTIEQDHLERYIGGRSLENESIDAVYILPLGSCPDLPAARETSAVSSVHPKLLNLKESLRRNCTETLRCLLNSMNMDSRDIMILFEYRGDIWAYRHDSLSETEVQLLRLSHPKAQAWYVWDQAMAVHETDAGVLTSEIASGEYASKFDYDVRNYDINYTMDENGRLVSGEVSVDIYLKKPLRALLFSYFPGYGLDKVTSEGKECSFLKEDFSKTWGYYEYGTLVSFPESRKGDVNLKFKVSGRLFDLAEGYIFLRDESQWYPNLPDWDGAAFTTNITVPGKNEVIAIGELEGHTVNPDGTESFKWASKEKIRAATFVAGKFLHTIIDAEGLKLDVALPKGVRTNILTQVQKYTLNELKNNIIFYTRLFGPVPYPTLKVAITPHSYGLGFPTLLILSEDAFMRTGHTWPDQFLAHEVAHQWWGNLVDGLSYRDVWLTEGMAEFSSMLYMQSRYSESRVKIYNENSIWAGLMVKPPTMSSPIDSETGDDDPNNISNFRETGSPMFPGLNFKDISPEPAQDVPFLEGPICLGTRLLHTCTTYPSMGYNDIIYTKGYFVFNMLFCLSKFTKEGNEGMFNGFRSICSTYKGQKISTATFFKYLENGMKIPLTDFLRSWYESNGIPEVEVRTSIVQRAGKYVVIAEAETDKDLFFGVPVRITLPEKKTAEYFLLFNKMAARGEWTLPSRPRDVDVDPMRTVFCTYGKLKK